MVNLDAGVDGVRTDDSTGDRKIRHEIPDVEILR
jgi:hypothetical protein